MAFLTYKKVSTEKSTRYERLKPLRLSGLEGPIARFVQNLPKDKKEESWHLSTAALLQWIGFRCESGQPTVVMDMGGGESNEVCLYEMLRVSGISRDRSTTLVFEFAVLVDEAVRVPAAQFKAAFEVGRETPPHLLQETLALSGGPNGGLWKWDAPAMNIGATVVQPHKAFRAS